MAADSNLLLQDRPGFYVLKLNTLLNCNLVLGCCKAIGPSLMDDKSAVQIALPGQLLPSSAPFFIQLSLRQLMAGSNFSSDMLPYP